MIGFINEISVYITDNLIALFTARFLEHQLKYFDKIIASKLKATRIAYSCLWYDIVQGYKPLTSENSKAYCSTVMIFKNLIKSSSDYDSYSQIVITLMAQSVELFMSQVFKVLALKQSFKIFYFFVNSQLFLLIFALFACLHVYTLPLPRCLMDFHLALY